MQALVQRPTPDCARVVKERSLTPQLGDGLLAALTREATLTRCSAYVETDLSSTLTSSNLDRLTKITCNNHDIDAHIIAPSICSDEDVILIGTLGRSEPSRSLSYLSSRSGTPRGDETPPTTLTGDGSLFFSDAETHPDLLSPVTAKYPALLDPKTVTSHAYGLKRTTVESHYQSCVNVDSLRKTKDASVIRPDHLLPEPDLLKRDQHAHPGFISASEEIPNLESLHGIVRGFFATNTNSRRIQSPTTVLMKTPNVDNKRKPSWDPQRLLKSYNEGALTLDEANETAREYGYLDLLDVIDGAKTPKKNRVFDVSDVSKKVANENQPVVRTQPSEAQGTTRQPDQRHAQRQSLAFKLATLSAEDGNLKCAKPLHIFVDMSNIQIGFHNAWKVSQNIPIGRHVRAPAFDFKVLASIMERNRAAKKKFLASSVASHVISRAQWPQHFVDAEQQGYKTNILSRVQRVLTTNSPRRRRKLYTPNSGAAYCANLTTSGEDSADEPTKSYYVAKNGEQGVDEILHLNMMNSILDDMRDPGNMILATGDAARAEFSDGFLEYAIRALSQGWNLELVTWKSTISSSWVNPDFRKKYGERFRIIYLDEFLEDLNADFSHSQGESLGK